MLWATISMAPAAVHAVRLKVLSRVESRNVAGPQDVLLRGGWEESMTDSPAGASCMHAPDQRTAQEALDRKRNQMHAQCSGVRQVHPSVLGGRSQSAKRRKGFEGPGESNLRTPLSQHTTSKMSFALASRKSASVACQAKKATKVGCRAICTIAQCARCAFYQRSSSMAPALLQHQHRS